MSKYKKRTIEKSLNSLIGVCPVIMITGPRQVGKTTLLNHLSITSNEKINYTRKYRRKYIYTRYKYIKK